MSTPDHRVIAENFMNQADSYRPLDPVLSYKLSAIYHMLRSIDDRVAWDEGHVHEPSPAFKGDGVLKDLP